MNKITIGAAIIVILAIGGFLILKNQVSSTLPQTQTESQNKQQSTSKDEFSDPKKAAHYESNTPEHRRVLAGVPINAVIDFNFDLVLGSEIKVEMTGKDYAAGKTIIDADKLAMRRKIDQSSPDGLYTVSYKACWADGSCHDGQFQFKIDRSLANDFTDMTGQKEVTINLQNISFNPPGVKISKGTKVTWVNQDNLIHTVNTDSHPSHTYYLNQNSRNLAKGDSYSLTFSDPGIYLYHCTPHADSMRGQILVEG